ncbi:MAG TPA: hypothetical protein VFS75_00880 [Candidatus Paceibacterota bacterium]|nr:hypothetical protein [Candidatus Paceibacterota bacterium]
MKKEIRNVALTFLLVLAIAGRSAYVFAKENAMSDDAVSEPAVATVDGEAGSDPIAEAVLEPTDAPAKLEPTPAPARRAPASTQNVERPAAPADTETLAALQAKLEAAKAQIEAVAAPKPAPQPTVVAKTPTVKHVVRRSRAS